jgi:hypothetical protein
MFRKFPFNFVAFQHAMNKFTTLEFSFSMSAIVQHLNQLRILQTRITFHKVASKYFFIKCNQFTCLYFSCAIGNILRLFRRNFGYAKRYKRRKSGLWTKMKNLLIGKFFAEKKSFFLINSSFNRKKKQENILWTLWIKRRMKKLHVNDELKGFSQHSRW